MDVVVVGAVNVDLVVVAPTLPRSGETVVGAGMTRHGGGKGANAAVAAARAGASVRLVGAVGDDDLGRAALDELRSEGVVVDDVAVLAGTSTGTALIVVDESGENQIAVGAGANGLVDAGAVRAAIGSPGCVLVSTEIPPDAVAAAVHAAVATGVRCVLNPAPVTEAVHELVSSGAVLTPNAGEAAALAARLRHADGGDGPTAGDAGPEATIAHATALAARSGAAVVVTLGGDGALVAEPGGALDRVAPHPTTVRDTTGAGDTFNGVLAARLATGDDLATAVRTANVAAALSVSEAGARTGMPRPDAIGAARRR